MLYIYLKGKDIDMTNKINDNYKGPINRIWVKYTPQKGNVCSCLKIYKDIKGVTCEQIGHNFFGTEADIMLAYFQNATIEENNKVMDYGIYIEKED